MSNRMPYYKEKKGKAGLATSTSSCRPEHHPRRSSCHSSFTTFGSCILATGEGDGCTQCSIDTSTKARRFLFDTLGECLSQASVSKDSITGACGTDGVGIPPTASWWPRHGILEQGQATRTPLAHSPFPKDSQGGRVAWYA